MATEKMYDLAFQYQKARLWKRLYDSEMFAVALPDGQTGYCSVRGMTGDPPALIVYVGKKGYNTYRAAAAEAVQTGTPPWMMAQDCLQCSFEAQGYLREGEREEVRRYAEAHHILLRGNSAYPQFTRYIPNRYPGEIEAEAEQAQICEALDAAAALAEQLRGSRKADLGIVDVEKDVLEIPYLIRDGGGFRLEHTALPVEFTTPRELDEKTAAKIRKLKKSGILECEILRAVGEPGEDPAKLPAILLCVDNRQGYLLPVMPIPCYEENPDGMLDHFLNTLIENRICPRAVKLRDGQTRAMLEDFCMKTGVLLALDDYLPTLDDFFDYISSEEGDEDDEDEEDSEEDEVWKTLEYLSTLPDRELKRLPRDTVDQLLDWADMGGLPDKLERRLRRLFKK